MALLYRLVIGLCHNPRSWNFERTKSISIIITDQSTWPPDLIEFLESNYETFLGRECRCPRNSSVHEYDTAIYKIRGILRKYSLIGYHCTKLTTDEINCIRTNGMSLQNAESLKNRVSSLRESGLISVDIEQELISRNQADDSNRANMLWFCFFEPFLAGRDGIERFFRSWGGEALYNSHEAHPITGNALLNIGTPCVIKANVPIASLKDSFYPDLSMIRAFLSKSGHQLVNEIECEGFSTKHIDAQNIIEIIEHPSNKFNTLTKFDSWGDGNAAL